MEGAPDAPPAKRGQEAPITAAEDFMFRVTAQRPAGGLTVFRSKLWWGLLLDEHKRMRGKNGTGLEWWWQVGRKEGGASR